MERLAGRRQGYAVVLHCFRPGPRNYPGIVCGLALWLAVAITSLYPVSSQAVTVPAGDMAPHGQPDGQLNVADLPILQRIIRGSLIPSAQETLAADVAPLGSSWTREISWSCKGPYWGRLSCLT